MSGGAALYTAKKVLNASPKRVVLSGPSGFVGSRVLDELILNHQMRLKYGVEPGEIVLLSANPGSLMKRLAKRYGEEKMRTLRASRVDYYTQHSRDVWIDHLGALGCGDGDENVFINLAAVAGPVQDKPDAMQSVNYSAAVAAAAAAKHLGFSHFIQSSTQATNTERAGQVNVPNYICILIINVL